MYNASQNAEYLSLTAGEYNFLMSLTGILLGFTFMFFTVYIIVNYKNK